MIIRSRELNIVILDALTLGEDIDTSALDSLGSVTSYSRTEAKERVERIKNADIVITNKVVIDKEVIDQSPSLKLICIAATGMNNIDLNYAAFKGISVKNVAGYSTQSVVQHTFAMALYLIEKLAYHDENVKSERWSRTSLFTDLSQPFYQIANRRWGIIGLGTIGKEVAKVATAFGADVCYYSTSGKNNNQPYRQMELEHLLQECDIISIHAPLNEKTVDLIDENNLHLIKESSIILNLGRGGIINETDLAFEIDRRKFYAGLDVLTKEPIGLENPLLHIRHPERLFITPHIAWSSIEARKKLFAGILENIRSFLSKDEKPQSTV